MMVLADLCVYHGGSFYNTGAYVYGNRVQMVYKDLIYSKYGD